MSEEREGRRRERGAIRESRVRVAESEGRGTKGGSPPSTTRQFSTNPNNERPCDLTSAVFCGHHFAGDHN